MKLLAIVRSALLAGGICLGVLATANSASAAPLIEYQNTFAYGATNENQQLAKVTVGGANVQIGGFGSYGQARSDTSLAWVIFDMTDLSNPVWQSATQQVGAAGSMMWYDSPTMNFTLLANHTYGMGVAANKIAGTGGFYWGGGDFPFGGGNQTANGLTLLDDSSGVRPGFCNGGSGPCGSGTQTLSSFMTGTYPDVFSATLSNRTKMALHIQPAAPVPEPAQWTMLIAGLLVIGFIARRRNQHLAQ